MVSEAATFTKYPWQCEKRASDSCDVPGNAYRKTFWHLTLCSSHVTVASSTVSTRCHPINSNCCPTVRGISQVNLLMNGRIVEQNGLVWRRQPPILELNF